jgi:hypothetical protein
VLVERCRNVVHTEEVTGSIPESPYSADLGTSSLEMGLFWRPVALSPTREN